MALFVVSVLDETIYSNATLLTAAAQRRRRAVGRKSSKNKKPGAHSWLIVARCL